MIGRITTENWVIVIVIAVFVFAVFSPLLGGSFLNWDDNTNFLNNAHYRGLGADYLKWIFIDSFKFSLLYIPFTWLSWSADYVFWGMNPFGYHLTNIIIHIFSAIVLYFLIYRLLKIYFRDRVANSNLTAGAALAALLWAVHPLRVESVAWISERKDVLCGLFYFITILSYLKYKQNETSKWYIFTMLFALIAILAKPMAASIPIVFLVLDYYLFKRLDKQIFIEKIPFAIIVLPLAITTLTAQFLYNYSDFKTLKDVLGIGDRILMFGFSLKHYLSKLIIPTNLSPMYELWEKLYIERTFWFLNYLITSGLLASIYLLRRKFPFIIPVFIFYVLTLLPVSGLAQNGPQIAADRYAYITSIGFFIILGGLMAYYNKKLLFTCATVLILIFSALTLRQEKIWHNSTSLWERAVAVSPESGFSRLKLASEYFALDRQEEAIEQYGAAMVLNGAYKTIFKIK